MEFKPTKVGGAFAALLGLAVALGAAATVAITDGDVTTVDLGLAGIAVVALLGYEWLN